MDTDGTAASILGFFILLLVDMFFYGFGSATEEMNRKEVERRAEEEKDIKSVRLWKIASMPTGFVNTMLLIVTMLNVFAGAFYFPIFNESINSWLQGVFSLPAHIMTIVSIVLSMIALLYILLTFGVLIPKLIATKVPDKWAYLFVSPVWIIMIFLKPVTSLVWYTAKGILFLFGYRNHNVESDITEEELMDLVQEGHEQGVLQESEAQMITNIFELDDKEVRDIMTHRNNIVAVDGNSSLSEAIQFMLSEKNSRYPVYEENIDRIIGIIHLKDACRYQMKYPNAKGQISKLKGLIREAKFVPRTKSVDELFKEMQSHKVHLAIVIDEYGQTDGLIAMEDILEEIVGNIQDEYDDEQEHIEETGNDEYVIEGTTPLEELEERFHITFENENYETLNGFMISKLDRIPNPDEQFEVDYAGYHFKILNVEKKMIHTVLVTKSEIVMDENQESMLEHFEK